MDLIQSKDYREGVALLEQAIMGLEPVDMPVKHHFAHGTYTRELFIPEGTVATGKIHRHSCINILAKGRIKVVSDEGTIELSAPYVFVSGSDVKKAVYALEDSVWINVHPWNGEDSLEQIEEKVIIPSVVGVCHQPEVLCLGEP